MNNSNALIQPPESEAELLARARDLAGMTLKQLTASLNLPMPKDLRTNKGWVGQLIEKALGATAGSKPEPDFINLGIELKTIPLQANGKPREGTYVCTASLVNKGNLTWDSSLVKKKLAHVLWVPVEANPDLPLAERRIGSAILWRASETELAQLKNDWQELTDMICLGQLDKITAHHGEYLQIRPKASNSLALCEGINEEGEKILTLPRGFYLRPTFTQKILQQYCL